jgi:hypothetical protein
MESSVLPATGDARRASDRPRVKARSTLAGAASAGDLGLDEFGQ